MSSDKTRKCVQLLASLTKEQIHDAVVMLEDMAEENKARLRGPRNRRAIVQRTWGMLAQLPTSSEDFSRSKAEEKAREDSRWQAR